MAGFDFIVPTSPGERAFGAVILRFLQRRAAGPLRERPTLLRFEWRKPTRDAPRHHYYVTLDGNFVEIQAFVADAAMPLVHFARGYATAARKHSKSTWPFDLALALTRATQSFANELSDLQEKFHGAGISVGLNSYTFRKTGIRTIDQVLRDASIALLRWRSGGHDLGPLVESLHTAAEVTIKFALSVANRGVSFADLVGEAGRRGILGSDHVGALLWLKDVRRDAKHRGQSVPRRALSGRVSRVVDSLHIVTLRLANDYPEQPA